MCFSEEDCEEFKVKKSSQSKRLSKRRDKERKRLPDGDSNKYDSNGHEVRRTMMFHTLTLLYRLISIILC